MEQDMQSHPTNELSSESAGIFHDRDTASVMNLEDSTPSATSEPSSDVLTETQFKTDLTAS